MDYKEKMDNSKINFAEIYEETMTTFCTTYISNPAVAQKLREKREFGLKKYGEHSFQNSFENAFKSPVVEHAIEECIDLMNYTLHLMFVSNIKGGKNFLSYANMLKRISDIYNFFVEEKGK